MYGPRWQTEMARKRGKSGRMIRYWDAGNPPPPPELAAELRSDIHERIDLLKALLRELPR